MARTIQIKRGLEKNLPTLKPGEQAFTTDTKKVFIGSDTGNVDITSNVDTSKFASKETTDVLATQIAERIKKVNGKSPDSNGNIQLEIPQVDTSNLATKTEIQQLSLTFKESYPTLSALQTAYPTGDNANHVVLADNMIYTYKNGWVSTGIQANGTGILDNSVTFDKASNDLTSKIFEGKNIFPPNISIVNGKYLNNDGVLATSSISNVTDFIEILPNQYYTLPYHSADPGGYYDKDYNFISRINFVDSVPGASNNPAIFKTPSTARYIKVNVNVSDASSVIHLSKFMIVFGKTYPSSKIPYGLDGYNILVGEKQLKERSVSRNHIQDIIKNLFNKNAITSGQYVTNTGTFTTSASLGYSEYIPVESNKIYSIPLISGSAGVFFDSNKTFISVVTALAGSTTSFITPTNAAFVILNVNINSADSVINKDRYMLVKSNSYPSKYFAYDTEFLPWIYELGTAVTKNKWEGKVIDTFGDSITWYDGKAYSAGHLQNGQIAQGYQTHIRNELGANINNYGASGNTLVQIAAIIKSKTFANTHAVTITGGVNDWFKGTPIGQISPIGSTFDTTTSYGALQSSIEYIMGIKPKMKIYLITPIRGMFKPDSTESLAGQELPPMYQELIKSVGKLYGLPVCDWYDMTGFNRLNYSSFYLDTGATLGDRYVHVGDEGYRRMADILVPFLKDF